LYYLWNFEKITTQIALSIWWIDPSCGVQGLVDVANVMNKQPQNKGFCLLWVWDHASNISINKVVCVISVSGNPVIDVINCLIYTIWIINELGIVLKVSALIQVRSVDEMPSVLPLPINTRLFELVSKGCTLNKWIIELRFYHLRSRWWINSENLICLV
jgi:hypothetical protein